MNFNISSNDIITAIPNILKLRKEANLTQLELSQIIGVTEASIQNWEKGRAGLKHIERVIALCRALNCEAQDLVTYPSNTSQP